MLTVSRLVSRFYIFDKYDKSELQEKVVLVSDAGS